MPPRDSDLYRLYNLKRKIFSQLNQYYSKWGNWQNRVRDTLNKRVDQMAQDYPKKQAACEEDGFARSTFTDERISDDPCKAASQLTKNIVRWSFKFNRHCDPNKPTKFYDKMAKEVTKVGKMMRKRLNCQ